MKTIKRNLCRVLPYAAILTVFSACSSSEPDVIAPEDTVEYKLNIDLKIANSLSTKAEGDDTETKDEIKSLCVALFKGDTFQKIVNAEKDVDNWKITVEVEPGNKPDALMAFANVTLSDIETAINGKTLESLTVSSLDETNGVPMTNLITPASNSVKIPAEAYNGSEAVTFTLERVCSQVSVKWNTPEENYQENLKIIGAGESKPQLVIDGWYYTTTDKESYLVRNFPDNVTTTVTDWTAFSETQVYPWSKSTGYTVESFPVLQKDVNENTSIYVAKARELTLATGSPTLVHETTRPTTAYSQKNGVAAVAIKGHYTIDGVNTTLYRFKDNTFYTEDAYWEAMCKDQNVLYKDGNPLTAEELKTYCEATPSYPEYGSAYVTVQLKSDANLDDLTDKDKKAITLDAANSALKAQCGYMEKYNGGSCYFIVPINHKNTLDVSKEGYYGLVRNHSYTIEITKISGFGRGVASDDDYVLDFDSKDGSSSYTISFKAEVAGWVPVDTQHAEIK